MKIIFLDIDGVLNSRKFIQSNNITGLVGLDPQAISLLNKLISETDSEIVISSSWRIVNPLPRIQHKFEDAGFRYAERIIGTTCSIGNRTDEIDLWLRQVSPHVSSFVILDDDTVEYKNFVKTSFDVGLTEQDVAKAKVILNGK